MSKNKRKGQLITHRHVQHIQVPKPVSTAPASEYVITDTNLFIVGEDFTDDTILAVLAALQGYLYWAIEKNKAWNSTHKQNRKFVIKSHLVCPEHYAFLFEKCLPTLVGVYADVSQAPKEEYTYRCTLTLAKALAICSGNEKPLAIALGIIVGCQSDSLANVSDLCTQFESYADVYWDSKLANYIPYPAKEGSNKFFHPNEEQTLIWDVKIARVFGSKVIVGYSSFETYLGCCLKKPVIEIQANPLLYKWSNPKYICITDASRLDELLRKGLSDAASRL